MSKREYNRRTSRPIYQRIIVQGELELTSPAVFSNGDSEGPMDMMILRDSVSERALLPGSSLAGALRAYLELYKPELAELLFGAAKKNNNPDLKKSDPGAQSPLIIWDALSKVSKEPPEIELRDGVKINARTGVADKGAKYDLELLAAGTTFELCFELLIDTQNSQKIQLLEQALYWVLSALEQGHIQLGMKKTRGFGECQVEYWYIRKFNLQTPQHMIEWLEWKPQTENKAKAVACSNSPIFKNAEPLPPSPQTACTLTATFKLDSSLLIRADASHARNISKEQEPMLDAAHLTTGEDQVPIIPGTSWAGVLRHRAERICNTIGVSQKLVCDLFGWTPDAKDKQTKGQQSRIVVKDSHINQPEPKIAWIQNRIAIDRFTGGAYHGALFSEQPVWPTEATTVTLELQIKPLANKPVTEAKVKAEVGLLLLLLKDLWTGDLTIGGERSIGRGRLKGVTAELTYGETIWKITQIAETIHVTTTTKQKAAADQSKQRAHTNLQSFVDSLQQYPSSQAHDNQEISS